MKILKYVYYIYLFFALAFIYDGIIRLQSNEAHPWLSFLIATAAVFMFFFRRKYSKRMEDYYNKK